jgi:hypothetical protein
MTQCGRLQRWELLLGQLHDFALIIGGDAQSIMHDVVASKQRCRLAT